ncbi:DUF1569 domain-containing protein [Maribacter sp.]|uniref:DUF1569 domain-containing protein n=1 Tax=Maribacter sp. TaxID=1897614 RepID=UPI0025BBDFD9|nr:DUF1569 domain-containing protein [Maribacter sp.]
MQSLFNEKTYTETLDRIRNLNSNSERLWGKMSVGQMLWHCQYPLKIAIKNKESKKRGNFFIRLFIKKSMYNDKAWRKSLPTAPALKTKEEKEMEVEAEKLKLLITEFHALNKRKKWYPHPIFGVLTHEQWGKMQYKHLDHHLKQFGV